MSWFVYHRLNIHSIFSYIYSIYQANILLTSLQRCEVVLIFVNQKTHIILHRQPRGILLVFLYLSILLVSPLLTMDIEEHFEYCLHFSRIIKDYFVSNNHYSYCIDTKLSMERTWV